MSLPLRWPDIAKPMYPITIHTSTSSPALYLVLTLPTGIVNTMADMVAQADNVVEVCFDLTGDA